MHGRVSLMVSAGRSSGILDQPTWRRAGPGERTNIKKNKKNWVKPKPGNHCLPNSKKKKKKKKKRQKKKGKECEYQSATQQFPFPRRIICSSWLLPSLVWS
jgi:hypothetical protein